MALAEEYECDATVESVARALHKGTYCGAYFDIVGESVVIGTIIEGSDIENTVEIDLNNYTSTNAGVACFISAVHSAIISCETFAERVFDTQDNGWVDWAEEGDYDHLY